MSYRARLVCKRYVSLARVVLVPVLLTSVPAFAANRHAQERTARKACLNGDYAKGVSILSDLFLDSKDPTYVFNQGRCFEQNRRFEDAVARFEEYLRLADEKVSPQDRAAAEKHLADCKEKVALEHPSPPTQPEPLAPPPPMVSPFPVPTAGPDPTTGPAAGTLTLPARPPQSAQRRRGMLAAGIITASVGVGGLVTGLVLNLKANSMINDWENKTGSYSKTSADEQKTYETLAWVGYGVGAACVATGVVLIALGARSRPASSGDVALVPSIGPGQMGALLKGAF